MYSSCFQLPTWVLFLAHWLELLRFSTTYIKRSIAVGSHQSVSFLWWKASGWEIIWFFFCSSSPNSICAWGANERATYNQMFPVRMVWRLCLNRNQNIGRENMGGRSVVEGSCLGGEVVWEVLAKTEKNLLRLISLIWVHLPTVSWQNVNKLEHRRIIDVLPTRVFWKRNKPE